MNYVIQKLSICVAALIFFMVGGVIGLGSGLNGNWLVGAPVLAITLFSVWYLLFVSLPQVKRFQTMTYAWYKKTYPLNVTPAGVTCHSCGSRKIHVRALMRRTFHMAHMCGQCGETLYYSPEK